MVKEALGVPTPVVDGKGERVGEEEATFGVENGRVGLDVTVTLVGEALMLLFEPGCFCETLWPIKITIEIRMILNITAPVINIFLLTPGFF